LTTKIRTDSCISLSQSKVRASIGRADHRATAEIESVTQHRAASVEEFAAMAQELNAHAESLNAVVDQLLALAGASPIGLDSALTASAPSSALHPHRHQPA
jgi:hypothetical protein